MNTHAHTKSTILGDEYDETLIESIRTVLSFLGAVGDTQEWAVAGSQEIETRTLIIDGARIEIESETFIGITISGKSSTIDRISDLVSVEYNRRVIQKLSNGISPVYSSEVYGISLSEFELAKEAVEKLLGIKLAVAVNTSIAMTDSIGSPSEEIFILYCNTNENCNNPFKYDAKSYPHLLHIISTLRPLALEQMLKGDLNFTLLSSVRKSAKS